eukprot:15471067-Alexandrium_andersonii.AAC.1
MKALPATWTRHTGARSGALPALRPPPSAVSTLRWTRWTCARGRLPPPQGAARACCGWGWAWHVPARRGVWMLEECELGAL